MREANIYELLEADHQTVKSIFEKKQRREDAAAIGAAVLAEKQRVKAAPRTAA